jgi:hypothetical protein
VAHERCNPAAGRACGRCWEGNWHLTPSLTDEQVAALRVLLAPVPGNDEGHPPEKNEGHPPTKNEGHPPGNDEEPPAR